MSKSNLTETDILGYVFNKTTISWDSNTSLFISLHTGDPGEGGNQSTSEATYGSYQRVSVPRDVTGWTVSGNTAQNLSLIQFPACTSGSDTITHVGIGLSSSGATQLLYKGLLNSPLSVSNLIQPQFSPGALQIQED